MDVCLTEINFYLYTHKLNERETTLITHRRLLFVIEKKNRHHFSRPPIIVHFLHMYIIPVVGSTTRRYVRDGYAVVD